MQRLLSQTHRALAGIVLAGVLLQFYLAGIALFGAETFEPHEMLGKGLIVPILLLLGIALVGQLGKRLIGLSGLLVVLIIVQMMLPGLRDTAPWIAALHPVVALSLLGISGRIARTKSSEIQEIYQARSPIQTGMD
jgi:hypothetical protein